MALIPGTLPSDTCYGTPQDLLELFAQYLDVPAFALNSKVVFATASTGLTSDVIWINTTSSTNPILSITASGGFVDYVKNYINQASAVTIVGTDYVLISDTSDSGNTKRGLVSDIVPAAGSITPAQLSQPLTLGTAVASTSGTAIDFTSIPSWVKRVTVTFNEVSLSGSSAFLLQAGTSAGIVTTGYSGGGMRYGVTSIAAASFTTGVSPNNQTAAATYSGHAIWTRVSGNIWACSLNLGASGGTESGCISGGSITLSGTLDRIRITTVNGSDTFDAGSVNIMYE